MDTVESAREKVEVRNAVVTDIVAAACRGVNVTTIARQVKSYDFQRSSPKVVKFSLSRTAREVLRQREYLRRRGVGDGEGEGIRQPRHHRGVDGQSVGAVGSRPHG